MDQFGNPEFKVNPQAINLNSDIGPIERIDTQLPGSDTQGGLAPGTVAPAALGIGRRVRAKAGPRLNLRNPGSTLAQKLGTEETDDSSPIEEPVPQFSNQHVPRRRSSPSRAFAGIKPKIFGEGVGQRREEILETSDPMFQDSDQAESSLAASEFELPDYPSIAVRKGAADGSEDIFDEPTTGRDKLDLVGMILSFVKHYGIKKSADFFAKDESTIRRWESGKVKPEIDALQRILDRSGKALERFTRVQESVNASEGTLFMPATRQKLSVVVCTPVKGMLHWLVDWCRISVAKNYELGYSVQPETIIDRARDLVAQEFMNSGHTWSLWWDDDVVPTMGNPLWFQKVSGCEHVTEQTGSYQFVERLLSHNRPFVGGVYSGRVAHGPLVIQPELNPRNERDKKLSDAIRKNQVKGLEEVDWLAAGLSLIHRGVFERVRKKFPELEPPKAPEGEKQIPFPYFIRTPTQGEDVAFCSRVKACGIKMFLDTELFAMHIGYAGFLPEGSRPPQKNPPFALR